MRFTAKQTAFVNSTITRHNPLQCCNREGNEYAHPALRCGDYTGKRNLPPNRTEVKTRGSLYKPK